MKWHPRNQEIAVTESELASMTSDMLDAHHETLPQLDRSLEAWGRERTNEPTGFGRRSFLARAGLVTAGGIAFASVGASAGASLLPGLTRAGGASTSRPQAASLDVKVAALAASLENVAVATYTAGLSAATAGKLGAVPAAVATFATAARAQHLDHAAAWNAIIVSAGFKRISDPNAAIMASTLAAFAKVKDIPGLAKLALSLEEVAAATYLEAVEVVSEQKAIATAATIHPVEMQHAAILNFVLGNYPVPAPFASTTAAAPLSAVPALVK